MQQIFSESFSDIECEEMIGREDILRIILKMQQKSQEMGLEKDVERPLLVRIFDELMKLSHFSSDGYKSVV